MENLFVLAGPSGVGKGTVVAELLKRYPSLYVSISATTRPARPGEINGVHYQFISESDFDRILAEDGFLEWAVVHKKHRYGTLKSAVMEQVKQGNPVLLEIDLAGARQVREKYPQAKFIFLSPPSEKELLQRLLGRGTETAEEQKRRLETASVEMAAAKEFDCVVVNDDISSAATELAEILGIA